MDFRNCDGQRADLGMTPLLIRAPASFHLRMRRFKTKSYTPVTNKFQCQSKNWQEGKSDLPRINPQCQKQMLRVTKQNSVLLQRWLLRRCDFPQFQQKVFPKKLNSSIESKYAPSPNSLPLFLRDKRPWENYLYQDLLGMIILLFYSTSAALAGTLVRGGEANIPANSLSSQ